MPIEVGQEVKINSPEAATIYTVCGKNSYGYIWLSIDDYGAFDPYDGYDGDLILQPVQNTDRLYRVILSDDRSAFNNSKVRLIPVE